MDKPIFKKSNTLDYVLYKIAEYKGINCENPRTYGEWVSVIFGIPKEEAKKMYVKELVKLIRKEGFVILGYKEECNGQD